MFTYKKTINHFACIKKSEQSSEDKKILQRIKDMLKKYENEIIIGLLLMWITAGDEINDEYISESLRNPEKVNNVSDNYEAKVNDFVNDILYPKMNNIGENAFTSIQDDTKNLLHYIPLSEPNSDTANAPLGNQFDYRVFYNQWCDKEAGNLIVNITDTQRSNVKNIINDALNSDRYSLSEVKNRVKDTIGLTERQLLTNQKYYNTVRNNLKESNPKLSEKKLNNMASEAALKMANKQRNARAKSIARTELNAAHNQSAKAYIQWAIEHDYMKNVYKQWITSGNENVCPVCASLNGQKVPFNHSYRVPINGIEIDGPPMHPQCCCGEKFIEGDDKTTIQNKQNIWDTMTEAEKKAHINYYADKIQYSEYKKRLGSENMPKSLEEFQKLKYNNSEEFNNLKYYARNINGRSIEYVKIDRELEQLGIKNKGKAYPIEDVNIVDWSAHSKKRMKQDGVSQAEALAFKANAVGMLKKYPAPETQLNYYSDDGVLGVKEKDSTVNTVIGKVRFKDDTKKIIEVMKKWLQ